MTELATERARRAIVDHTRLPRQPGPQPADVTVSGPAQSLLPTLTRRLPLTDREAGISIRGDTALAQHWLDNTAHVGG